MVFVVVGLLLREHVVNTECYNVRVNYRFNVDLMLVQLGHLIHSYAMCSTRRARLTLLSIHAL